MSKFTTDNRIKLDNEVPESSTLFEYFEKNFITYNTFVKTSMVKDSLESLN